MKNKFNFKFYIFITFVLLSSILLSLLYWFVDYFEISYSEIIYTVMAEKKGADLSFFKSAIPYLLDTFLPFCLFFIILLTTNLLFVPKLKSGLLVTIKNKTLNINIGFILQLFSCIFSIVFIIFTFFLINQKLGISNYYKQTKQQTTIYQDYYIFPSQVKITAPENKRNLLYIYVESLENTYQDKSAGGIHNINYIPKLSKLATENLSFTNKLNNANGFSDISYWTIAGIFSTTSGLPFAYPVGNNADRYQYFAKNVKTLGDVLYEHGYTNEFLCGSDATFAGRRKFFEQHGNYKIFDLYTAREKNYIPQDYQVWWGFEDQKLYEIAKDELSRLSASSAPFNLTMLTVDTHHVGGYICSNCENIYENQLANVLNCTDTLLCNFIEWCKLQSWYNNTTIVITGDHMRMDNYLVPGSESSYNRTVFNCFVNPYLQPVNTSPRYFTTLDIYPTTLGALGFDIEGNKLGLGVNLFSDTKTLSEELGLDYIRTEFGKHSDYFWETFK